MSMTDEQFNAFAAAMPDVRRAETEQEREAIFAFRYDVYAKELGHKFGAFDHSGHRMHDEEDDKEYTTLLYTADEKGLTGTARLRHWEPGGVPPKDFNCYSMEGFTGIDSLHVGEIGRLMVRPDRRGGLILVALVWAILDHQKSDRHCDLLFADCVPGLVRHYERMGCRRYAGRMIPTPDGLMMPLVIVVSDTEHLRAINSVLAPKGERMTVEPLDPALFTELFDEHNVPVQFDKALVRAAIEDGVAANVGFLSQISGESIEALAEKGFIIRVPTGELLTEVGLGQRELFVVIDGEFESFSGERSLRRIYPGEVVGEVAFFSSDGHRTASVRCIEDGRVLVLRRHVLDELRVSAPAVAAEILFHLARTMADRTGRAHLAPATPRETKYPAPAML